MEQSAAWDVEPRSPAVSTSDYGDRPRQRLRSFLSADHEVLERDFEEGRKPYSNTKRTDGVSDWKKAREEFQKGGRTEPPKSLRSHQPYQQSSFEGEPPFPRTDASGASALTPKPASRTALAERIREKARQAGIPGSDSSSGVTHSPRSQTDASGSHSSPGPEGGADRTAGWGNNTMQGKGDCGKGGTEAVPSMLSMQIKAGTYDQFGDSVPVPPQSTFQTAGDWSLVDNSQISSTGGWHQDQIDIQKACASASLEPATAQLTGPSNLRSNAAPGENFASPCSIYQSPSREEHTPLPTSEPQKPEEPNAAQKAVAGGAGGWEDISNDAWGATSQMTLIEPCKQPKTEHLPPEAAALLTQNMLPCAREHGGLASSYSQTKNRNMIESEDQGQWDQLKDKPAPVVLQPSSSPSEKLGMGTVVDVGRKGGDTQVNQGVVGESEDQWSQLEDQPAKKEVQSLAQKDQQESEPSLGNLDFMVDLPQDLPPHLAALLDDMTLEDADSAADRAASPRNVKIQKLPLDDHPLDSVFINSPPSPSHSNPIFTDQGSSDEQPASLAVSNGLATHSSTQTTAVSPKANNAYANKSSDSRVDSPRSNNGSPSLGVSAARRQIRARRSVPDAKNLSKSSASSNPQHSSNAPMRPTIKVPLLNLPIEVQDPQNEDKENPVKANNWQDRSDSLAWDSPTHGHQLQRPRSEEGVNISTQGVNASNGVQGVATTNGNQGSAGGSDTRHLQGGPEVKSDFSGAGGKPYRADDAAAKDTSRDQGWGAVPRQGNGLAGHKWLDAPKETSPGMNVYTLRPGKEDRPFFCHPCNMPVGSPRALEVHLESSRHNQSVCSAQPFKLTAPLSPREPYCVCCEVCRVWAVSEDMLERHYGREHKMRYFLRLQRNEDSPTNMPAFQALVNGGADLIARGREMLAVLGASGKGR